MWLNHIFYWNNMQKSTPAAFLSSSTSQSSPSFSNYHCITWGLLPHLDFWRRKLPCNLLGRMLYTSVSKYRMVSFLRDTLCKPSDSNPKVVRLWKRRSIHLYLFDARELSFPQGDALIQFVLALKWKFPSQSARAKGNKKWHDLITSVTVVQQLKKVWHEALIN